MQSNLLPPKAPAVPAAQMSHEAQSAPLLMAKQTAAAKRPPAEQDAGKSGVDVTRASKRPRSGEWISPRNAWNLPPEHMVPEGLEIRDCGYMGVRWSRKKHKWRVRIKAHGKDNHVGFYSDALSAALAFDAAVKRFNPNWAKDPSIKFNFPQHASEPAAVSPNVPTVNANAMAALSHAPLAPLSGQLSSLGLRNFAVLDSRLALDIQRVSSPAGLSDLPAGAILASAQRHSMSPMQYGVGGPMLGGVSASPSPCPLSAAGSSRLGPLLSQLAAVNMMTGTFSPRPGSAGSMPTARLTGSVPRSVSMPCSAPIPCSVSAGDVSVSVSRPVSAGLMCDRVGSCTGKGVRAGPSGEGKVGGARQEKASLSHLLNDKSPLIRTPSPQDAATPSVISASKSSSSISTPSTVPSLSDIFSPGVHQYRGTSLPAMTGPPRLIPKTQNAGAESPPCRREAAPAKTRGDGEQRRETAEKDALRALVVMQSCKQSSTAMSLTGAPKAEPEVNRVHTGRVLPDAFDSRLYGAGSGKQLATAKKGKQNFRGVTWDKVKQMWRVRLCLAGGGREHIGYFSKEEDGAMAYQRAIQRLKKDGAESVLGTLQEDARGSTPLARDRAEPSKLFTSHTAGGGHAGAAATDTSVSSFRDGRSAGSWGHLLTDTLSSSLPGSPSASALFQAHINPTSSPQALNGHQDAAFTSAGAGGGVLSQINRQLQQGGRASASSSLHSILRPPGQ